MFNKQDISLSNSSQSNQNNTITKQELDKILNNYHWYNPLSWDDGLIGLLREFMSEFDSRHLSNDALIHVDDFFKFLEERGEKEAFQYELSKSKPSSQAFFNHWMNGAVRKLPFEGWQQVFQFLTKHELDQVCKTSRDLYFFSDREHLIKKLPWHLRDYTQEPKLSNLHLQADLIDIHPSGLVACSVQRNMNNFDHYNIWIIDSNTGKRFAPLDPKFKGSTILFLQWDRDDMLKVISNIGECVQFKPSSLGFEMEQLDPVDVKTVLPVKSLTAKNKQLDKTHTVELTYYEAKHLPETFTLLRTHIKITNSETGDIQYVPIAGMNTRGSVWHCVDVAPLPNGNVLYILDRVNNLASSLHIAQFPFLKYELINDCETAPSSKFS
ncbi:hypothetical protein OQJ19_04630 [Fluoribacter gormanii]|uniref:hypothetical protein n=1 Tax=Fluoribacter gormanii TaxID=464 RepID=UPI0022431ECB|nr:hypothetical protein [Fluoribacter gormanii]MCW8469942.1 hypothetical protein [Fluoribacter gormanii]